MKGIVEAQESLRAHLDRFDASRDRDDEAFANALVLIRVEIFDHIGYHMKALQRPLVRETKVAFDKLPPPEDDQGET